MLLSHPVIISFTLPVAVMSTLKLWGARRSLFCWTGRELAAVMNSGSTEEPCFTLEHFDATTLAFSSPLCMSTSRQCVNQHFLYCTGHLQQNLRGCVWVWAHGCVCNWGKCICCNSLTVGNLLSILFIHGKVIIKHHISNVRWVIISPSLCVCLPLRSISL